MTPRPTRRSLFRAGQAVAAPSGEQPRSQALTRAFVSRWTTAYLEAWRTKDAAAAVRLFTPDALYEVVPGDASQTYRGRDAIGRYWRDVTSGQSDIGYRQGTPSSPATGRPSKCGSPCVPRPPIRTGTTGSP
ncbi:nuclear transport factor 2 family protein [Streptomyces nogalater]